jgi:hypothetical protein
LTFSQLYIILFAGDDNKSDDELDKTSESGIALDDTDDSTNSDGEYEKSDYVHKFWMEIIRQQEGGIQVMYLLCLFNNLKFP